MSLIELLVALAVLAILGSLGVPSYQRWVRDTRIRNATESVQNALRYARTQAAQLGTNVRFEFTNTTDASWTVCVLNGATGCTGTGATTLQSFNAAGGASNVKVNVGTSIGTLTTQLTSGITTDIGITFTSLGRPLSYSGTTDLKRIDTSAQAGDRWLVTTVAAGGMVHVCDPQLSLATSPQGCATL
ncbi:hypothetical protein HY57_09020 [Dyella japonica A8]|uniref:Type II secretion system protein H n=2 Tax=Dyella japonica TaxID=231455 RepID=A0A075K0W7_9GAMM|nr:hypothetical protein HY57_09020 [Dyella japonica A8]